RVRIYVTPGSTTEIEHDMAKGAGEETFEDLSGGRYDREPPPSHREPPPSHREPPPTDRDDDRDLDAPPPPRDRPSDRAGERPYSAEPGRLRLDVRPSDASVYVDGNFVGLASHTSVIALPPGPHRVEVVRPGFRTEERDVEVAPGASRELSIEL